MPKQAAFEEIDAGLLEAIADLHALPTNAYNIRKDGEMMVRNQGANIDIVAQTDGKPGIEIHVKEGAKNEVCHIPVIITKTGLTDVVYNDFYIGDDADVTIIAGCGIHNSGDERSQHDGIHTFHIGKNAHCKYIERHYGETDPGASGEVVLNPQSVFYLSEGASCEAEMVQLRGVDSTIRDTDAELDANAKLVIEERLLTQGHQKATSNLKITMNGKNSRVEVISRTVAQDHSSQSFVPLVTGNCKCRGHVQCDSIIMDNGRVKAVPAIEAASPDATLLHEAAIGKIAGEQIVKLMTLGLTEEEAEKQILDDFLS